MKTLAIIKQMTLPPTLTRVAYNLLLKSAWKKIGQQNFGLLSSIVPQYSGLRKIVVR